MEISCCMALVKDLKLTGTCKVLSGSLIRVLSKSIVMKTLHIFIKLDCLTSERSGGIQQSQAREAKEIP